MNGLRKWVKISVAASLLLVFLLGGLLVAFHVTSPRMPGDTVQLLERAIDRGIPAFETGITDTVRDGDVPLWFEVTGDPARPVVVLVMGLATSAIEWPNSMVQRLVDAGFCVIRFDHRDVGRSGWVKDYDSENPYTLSDMAHDVIRILDYAGIGRAHLIGMSMGGMIAQQVALQYPERVLSLTSIVSSCHFYDPELTSLTPAIKWHMLRLELKYDRNNPLDRISRKMETVAILRNMKTLPDSTALRVAAKGAFMLAHDHWTNPDATDRHIRAIQVSGSRCDALRQLDMPVLILHGTADPLILPEHGEKMASLIPGAEFYRIEGMGHALYEPYLSRMLAYIIPFLQRQQQHGLPSGS